MSKQTPIYYSYLLRLRLVDNAGQPIWRITLQAPGIEEERAFANIAALYAYLAELIGPANGGESYIPELKGENFMADLTVRVHRTWTEHFEDTEGRKARHIQRAQLLHGLVAALDLEVKEWGETDALYPREIVEIVIALGSAGVFTAMVAVFQSWLARDKIKEIEIVKPDGTLVSVRGATARDLEAILNSL